MKLISLDEFIDQTYGPMGSARREAFEADMRQLEEEWQRAHMMGHLIKKTRKEQRLTQAELGRQADVRPSEISRIERGLLEGCSYESIVRIFRALGMKLTLQTPKGQDIQLA